MFFKKIMFGFVLTLISLSLFPFGVSFEQSDSGLVNFSTTSEVSKIVLSLTKESLESEDFDNAEKISKFTTDYFGKQVHSLRSIDAETADDLHLLLLDIHADILSKTGTVNIIAKINNAINTFDKTTIPEQIRKNVIASMLSVADEQYQHAIQNNDQISYRISKNIVDSSIELYNSTTISDERLKLELDSFFSDLQSQIDKKSNFVSVGTIITVIQRDLIGTETVVNQNNLYNVIYGLYSELLLAIDSGDYSAAEELAIEAYLENFEYLEADIEKVDADLLYSLEIDMREELRDMIKNKQDPKRIRIFLEESIIPDLNKAESLVSEYLAANPSNISTESAVEKQLKEMGDSTEEEKTGVKSEVDFIRESLQAMLVYYEHGDYQSAYATARTAYLDSYEFVEIPLRSIDPDFTLEVEYQFAELRNKIKEEASYEEVQRTAINIKRNLDESERLVTGTGELAPTIAFSSSFAVIFREGLESVLILGAIITYLEASRNNKFKRYVYYGIVAAIGATVITWFIASFIVEISGASRELVEAIAALSATGVLFYVSFWILNKVEHKKWMEFVKAKVWQATTTGGVMVFVLLSFFTVYREGFETVLFYQAMFSFAKYMEMYVGLGFVLGILSLLGIYFIMRKLGKRLPLRALFGLTMGIGAYLSIAFLGNAIRELQTLDVLPYTSMLGTIPRLDINLSAMTGIYPTLETVLGQIILLGIYLTLSSYVLIIQPRKRKKIESMRKSRKMVDA